MRPDSNRISTLRSAILTQYGNVTDRQTDRRKYLNHIRLYTVASHADAWWKIRKSSRYFDHRYSATL